MSSSEQTDEIKKDGLDFLSPSIRTHTIRSPALNLSTINNSNAEISLYEKDLQHLNNPLSPRYSHQSMDEIDEYEQDNLDDDINHIEAIELWKHQAIQNQSPACTEMPCRCLVCSIAQIKPRKTYGSFSFEE